MRSYTFSSFSESSGTTGPSATVRFGVNVIILPSLSTAVKLLIVILSLVGTSADFNSMLHRPSLPLCGSVGAPCENVIVFPVLATELLSVFSLSEKS